MPLEDMYRRMAGLCGDLFLGVRMDECDAAELLRPDGILPVGFAAEGWNKTADAVRISRQIDEDAKTNPALAAWLAR